jgi:hypothetical protein
VNTSEHEWTRDNTRQHEWTRVRTRVNTSQNFVNTSEHESKTDEHEWTRVKNDEHEWTRVKNLWTRVNTSQKRILKEAPCSFNLSPWWRSVLCNCTRDSQDSWRPTGCWISRRRGDYRWIKTETKSRFLFTIITEPEVNNCFSIIS